MTEKLTLISHHLCPYVQRAAIALAEKGVPFERINIDLADKPDWFLELSPLGKVPVLKVGDRVIFESAVILEYLEETQPNPLHPADPLARAEHRAWIEFGSASSPTSGASTPPPDAEAFAAKDGGARGEVRPARDAARGRPLVRRRARSRWSTRSSAPVFRYFDVFDAHRRLRHPRGQAEARRLAPGAGRAAVGPRCRRRRLPRPAAPLHRRQGRRTSPACSRPRAERLTA